MTEEITRQQEVKNTIIGILEDDTVRVKELTYKDLSLDHSNIEITIVLEQQDDD